MPKVSVIVPNYNYSNYLVQRLDSILNQTFQDFEVIILDDASTDNSLGIIQNYRDHAKIKRIEVNRINTGNPFAQWKKGLELASAPYIWITEADDWCEPEILEKLVPVLDMQKNTGIAYVQSKIADKDGKITGKWENFPVNRKENKFDASFGMKGQEFINHFLIHWNVIPNSSGVIFRKKIYDQVKGVDSSIQRCADWHLWLRMLQVSDIFFVAEPLNYFRRHEKSVINKPINTVNDYVSRYDVHMRKKLDLHKNKKARKINNNYIWLECGYKGAWLIEHGNFFKGWKYIARSFINTKFNLLPVQNGFKSSIKVIIK